MVLLLPNLWGIHLGWDLDRHILYFDDNPLGTVFMAFVGAVPMAVFALIVLRENSSMWLALSFFLALGFGLGWIFGAMILAFLLIFVLEILMLILGYIWIPLIIVVVLGIAVVYLVAD